MAFGIQPEHKMATLIPSNNTFSIINYNTHSELKNLEQKEDVGTHQQYKE